MKALRAADIIGLSKILCNPINFESLTLAYPQNSYSALYY